MPNYTYTFRHQSTHIIVRDSDLEFRVTFPLGLELVLAIIRFVNIY